MLRRRLFHMSSDELDTSVRQLPDTTLDLFPMRHRLLRGPVHQSVLSNGRRVVFRVRTAVLPRLPRRATIPKVQSFVLQPVVLRFMCTVVSGLSIARLRQSCVS